MPILVARGDLIVILFLGLAVLLGLVVLAFTVFLAKEKKSSERMDHGK